MENVMRLILVSKWWKVAAESCPFLWDFISISPPGFASILGRQSGTPVPSYRFPAAAMSLTNISQVQYWLRNSKTIPLTIEFTFPPLSSHYVEVGREMVLRCYQMFHLILKEASRLRKLRLVARSRCMFTKGSSAHPEGCCIHEIVKFLKDTSILPRARQLKELELRHTHIPFAHPIPFPNSLQLLADANDCHALPALQSLRFDSFFPAFPPQTLARITHLALDKSSSTYTNSQVNAARALLAQCVNLVQLTIGSRVFDGSLTTDQTRVLFPRMRRLYIKTSDVWYQDLKFLWPIAPRLERISFTAEAGFGGMLMHGCHARHDHHLLPSLKRLCGSQEPLRRIQHLDLGGVQATTKELIEILAQCPVATFIRFHAMDGLQHCLFQMLHNFRLSLNARSIACGGCSIVLWAVGWNISIRRDRRHRLDILSWTSLCRVARSSYTMGEGGCDAVLTFS